MFFVRKAFLFFVLGFAAPVSALDFYENHLSGEIFATGEVEKDDAEKIVKIINLEYKQKHNIVRDLVTISFDSLGGNLIGGLRLGYAIRQLGVHTNIKYNQSCMSACALAFLAGQERTVEGNFGVHAASFDKKNKTTKDIDQINSVQKLSAIINSYVNEMTGRSDVAFRALSTSASDISILSDAELVSMNVITIARRPSQFGRPEFKCPAYHNFTVLSTVCVHMDISMMDKELNDLYLKIQKESFNRELEVEQNHWRRYRNSCINNGQPNGYASVVYCIREAYTIRRDQLMSIWLSITTKKSAPVSQNWKPITE
jgi:uncharacterized protein YecT (DUF1311 family)